MGVANHLAKRGEIFNGSELFGPAFEHFLINEIKAYLSYAEKDLNLSYWRTTDHLEIDCIIGDKIAIEIKGTVLAHKTHYKNLAILAKEEHFSKYILISRDPAKRRVEGDIEIYPWYEFLTDLWSNKIVV